MNGSTATARLDGARRAASRRERGAFSHAARLALIAFIALGFCMLRGASTAAAQTACPGGQIPSLNGTGCIFTQSNPSLTGYGLPYQTTNLPESGRNGAAAMHRCNGGAVPVGTPCPGTVQPGVNYASTTNSTSVPANGIYNVTTSSNTSTSTSPANSTVTNVSVNLTTGAATTTPASTNSAASTPQTTSSTGSPASSSSSSTASSTTTVAATPPPDPTVELTTLLGDWYTGWIQYLGTSFGLSQSDLNRVATLFASLPGCPTGQADTCEASVWQQLSEWVPAAATDSTSTGS